MISQIKLHSIVLIGWGPISIKTWSDGRGQAAALADLYDFFGFTEDAYRERHLRGELIVILKKTS